MVFGYDGTGNPTQLNVSASCIETTRRVVAERLGPARARVSRSCWLQASDQGLNAYFVWFG